MQMINRIFNELIFWIAWIVIPIVWEIGQGLLTAVAALMSRNKEIDDNEEKVFFPYVTILIPVYNSAKTLKICLQSIVSQNYPLDKIGVVLIDNGSKDDSFEIFKNFQKEHPHISIWWDSSRQGKSKALNKGIFLSTGKYIINIDSDGWLDKNAIRNVVFRFERDNTIACMTGVVLIDHHLIEQTDSKLLKLIRKCELFEYMESFLVTRKIQSVTNSLYTLSGAFSCFRTSILLKTQMYNNITVGEDTHMTFQIKDILKKKMVLCENAFFYAAPIEDFNKLYTQRQRWQRGEIEVASLFTGSHLGSLRDFFKKPAMRILVTDHTMTFPRFIWYFAMIYLYFINYPLKLIIGANLLLYVLYVFSSLIFFCVGRVFLREQKEMREYICRNFMICFLMPIYRFLVYWIRMAGIINSIGTMSVWKSSSFSEEIHAFKNEMEEQYYSKLRFIKTIERLIHHK